MHITIATLIYSWGGHEAEKVSNLEMLRRPLQMLRHLRHHHLKLDLLRIRRTHRPVDPVPLRLIIRLITAVLG
jgi:hypothetical protein